MTVIDYAWFAPTIAQLDAAGVTGVIRYVGPPSWGKTIQQAEFDALIAAGKTVTLVFEIGSDDGAGGFAAGVANAHTALLYVPSGYTGAIYFAIDTAVSGADLDTAVAYIAGASSVVGPAKTGDYAEGAVCEQTEAAGTARYHWQSESTSFPDNDVLQPMTQLWQKVDGSPFPGDADFDLVAKPDYGQHPSPDPTPNKDDDMYAFVIQPPARNLDGTTQVPGPENEAVVPLPYGRTGVVTISCDFAPQQVRSFIGGPGQWKPVAGADGDGWLGIPLGQGIVIPFAGSDICLSFRHRGGNDNDNHPVTVLVIPA